MHKLLGIGVDDNGDITLTAVVDHIFCPARRAVPERQDYIGSFNDLDIPLQRSGPAVLLILRQKLGQLDSMRQRVLPCGGVHALRTARNDLAHSIGEVLLQVVDLQPSWTL